MARSLILKVKNNTGSTLLSNKAVYITGFDENSQSPTVNLASADDSNKLPAIGLVDKDIADGGTGKIKISGSLGGINTSSIEINSNVYVGSNGEITFINPASVPGSNSIAQQIGVVITTEENGQILLFSIESNESTLHAASHRPDGVDDLELTHSNLQQVSTDQHHAKSHASSHASNGNDPIDGLTVVDGKTLYDLGTEAAAASHSGVSSGYILQTNYLDSNRVKGSEGYVIYTGTTTAGKATNWPDTDGYFYDNDGKQFRLDPSSGMINVAQFGVRVAAADNSDGLIAMREHMILDRDRYWTVIFGEQSTYQYLNNRWLYGVGYVDILADGVTLKCTTDTGFNSHRRPLYVPHFFFNEGDTASVGANQTIMESGDLIDTADIGDIDLVLSTIGDYVNYNVGNWILVYGYALSDSGFPLQHRYFDYAKVEAIDSGTGTITLDRRIKFGYDSRWKDFANHGINTEPFGAPRILNLERGFDYYNTSYLIRIKGAIMEGPNTIDPEESTSCPNVQAIKVVYEGLTIKDDHAWVGSADVFICKDVQATDTFGGATPTGGGFEVDKFVNLTIMDNCKLYKLTAGTGAIKIVLKNSVINGGSFTLSPMYLEATNNDFINTGTNLAFGLYFTQYHTRSIQFDNNRWDGNKVYPAQKIQVGKRVSIAVDTVTDGYIEIDSTDTDAELLVVKSTDYGSFFIRDDGYTYGFVTDIFWNEADKLSIGGTWTQNPSPGDTWYSTTIDHAELNDTDEKHVVSGTSIIGDPCTRRIGRNLYRATFTSRDIKTDAGGVTNNNLKVLPLGFITRVKITVIRAYSGILAGTPEIRLRTILNNNVTEIARIDVETTGTRVIELGLDTGVLGGDVFFNTNLLVLADGLHLSAKDTAHSDAFELPVVEIEVDVIPYLSDGISV